MIVYTLSDLHSMLHLPWCL